MPRLLLLFAAVSLMSQIVGAAERNVVLIVADDQSPDAGCYGNTAIKTPNMDALAAAGTRFTEGDATKSPPWKPH